jgi:hypothetical protein
MELWVLLLEFNLNTNHQRGLGKSWSLQCSVQPSHFSLHRTPPAFGYFPETYAVQANTGWVASPGDCYT